MAYTLAPTDETFLASAPKRFQETFAIARPASEVWNDLTKDGTLDWCRALSGLTWTSPRPFGVGTTRQVKVLRGLLALDERYVVWEEGRRKAFVGVRANLPLIKRIAEDYVVEPDGEGACRFTWTVAVEPTAVGRPGGPLNAAIFASLFKDTRRHYGVG
ncbi:SRPBCC family protein [Patulibacter defluvii]|uniref:SRPBCC family protein n=1 Tax=Patulibacter defluvii TaxID=3095358 RepID=UPI002A75722B|nr:SRPBCC family protein [Patulibacter sp. DM4]